MWGIQERLRTCGQALANSRLPLRAKSKYSFAVLRQPAGRYMKFRTPPLEEILYIGPLHCPGMEEPLLGHGWACVLHPGDTGRAGPRLVPELLESVGVPILTEERHFWECGAFRSDCAPAAKLWLTAGCRYGLKANTASLYFGNPRDVI